MRLTSAHDSLLKGALTDKLQDFLLVDTIILFCRQMNKLEQQIVDVEIHRIPGHPHLLHFFIQLLHTLTDSSIIVLFNGSDKSIQPILTQNNPPVVDLYFFLIQIDILFFPERLKRIQDTGSGIGFCDCADIMHFFPYQHSHRIIRTRCQHIPHPLQIFLLTATTVLRHIIAVNKADIILFLILRHIENTVGSVLLQIFEAALVQLSLCSPQFSLVPVLQMRQIMELDINISNPLGQPHMVFDIFQIDLIIFSKQ